MRIPTLKGVIDRRILANFRIDGDIMASNLPKPFRPKLVGGYAIGGICLIRLKHVRPKFINLPFGLTSENAAHRIAVQWSVDGEEQEGVYIPRRDSNSRFNGWVGGTLFPGIHHLADFEVIESTDKVSVSMKSQDGSASVCVSGKVADGFQQNSVFSNLSEASDFFEKGYLGYSPTRNDGRYEGLELKCENWKVESLSVDKIQSSYFEDEKRFPSGSVEFDCALLMRGIEHEWHSRQELCCKM